MMSKQKEVFPLFSKINKIKKFFWSAVVIVLDINFNKIHFTFFLNPFCSAALAVGNLGFLERVKFCFIIPSVSWPTQRNSGNGWQFLISSYLSPPFIYWAAWRYWFLMFLFCVLSTATESAKDPIQIVYVPSHLYHILFELFKVRTAMFIYTYPADEKYIYRVRYVDLSQISGFLFF